MADYLRRVVDSELDELLPGLPAIALEGAKGVGKTATAERRAATIHRLDDPGQLTIAEAEPARLAVGAPPILIDEWQRLPATWDVVRRSVDADRTPGRFLLTGSATPGDALTHSGAGRIVTLRMRPLTLAERGVGRPTVSLRELLSGARPGISGTTDVGLEDYAREIVTSGFPGLRGLPERARRAQLDGYVARIVEHDFPDMGRAVRNPAALRRWLTAYAASASTAASYETIRDAATGGHGEKPAKTTTAPYVDILQRLWIIEPVPAWLPTPNRIARLASPPRHQLADPALAARILGVGVEGLLAGRGADRAAHRLEPCWARCSSPSRPCPFASSPRLPRRPSPTSERVVATARSTSSWRATACGSWASRSSWVGRSRMPTCVTCTGSASRSATHCSMRWC